LDSPALVIYPGRVKENIRLLKTMVDDVQQLRPHIKTNKSKEATQLMMEAGIQKFKCATIAEAELLGICGAADVLLAYQPAGPKVQRFISVIRQYPATKYACLIDNLSAADDMAVAFAAAGLTVPVYIDLNVGQNRTGIAPGDDAIQLIVQASKLKGITIKGLHAYDGHIRDIDYAARTITCNETFEGVAAMRNMLVQMNYEAPVIVAGGSPTFPIHAKRKGVECSPGTFIFWDKGYSDGCPEQPFKPAALLVTRVISLPTATYICLDLGHKSVAAENELPKRVYFPDAPHLKPVAQSEEHLVLDAGEGHAFKVGDVLYGIPQHICPTVALYERAITVENGTISGEWKIAARDRKISL
jgi:D-serine deaminase-like pyridoxal phosphate-dependent protein